MNAISLLLILVIGLLFWGGWPLIAQGSKLSDPFVRGFLVNIVTAVGFLPFIRGKVSWATLTSRGAGILLLAGIFNFAGHALFPKLQTTAGSQISLLMAMIPALCVIASAVGGPLFYGDQITPAKTIFTAFIVVGVVGLAFTSLK